MPGPAEWVNVQRVRVKDAVTPIWWLSPTPRPRASNRRVLTPYSDDMLKLLKNGYNRRLAAGVVAAGATLDSLIPPSGLLVIYGIIVEESIGNAKRNFLRSHVSG